MPTISIDMTNQQAVRLADAWEALFGTRPTIPEARTYLVQILKNIVHQGEAKAAEDAKPAPTSFDPT